MRKYLGIFVVAMLGAVAGVGAYKYMFEPKQFVRYNGSTPAVFSKYQGNLAFPNFVDAVERARPAVVHIKSTIAPATSRKGSPYDFFNPFNSPYGGGVATGSGVIISANGYIATNNHVVNNAKTLTITLTDNRSFTAEVIGTDPNTDLALLKVNAENLPYVDMGNSDEVRIGEWVVAIGNPLELTSTVTAGIVSARGRDLRLLNDQQYRIESFIQTDAAVNPGNSGGALVDVNGKLVGINTAIASQTGLYQGYSFAVPSAIVKKVMDDLLQFGEVRRGILGVSIENLDAEKAETHGIDILQGVYVAGVSKSSGAAKAGIEQGDVIVEVEGKVVNNSSELQEQIARFRPGDKVNVRLLRKNKEKDITVVLGKIEDSKDLGSKSDGKSRYDEEVSPDDEEVAVESTTNLRDLTASEKEKLGIEIGIKVDKAGEELARGGIRNGFVITKINGKEATSAEMVEKEIKAAKRKGTISIEGLYKKDTYASFQFSI